MRPFLKAPLTLHLLFSLLITLCYSSYAAASGICPQNRTTKNAPNKILTASNPIPKNAGNVQTGKRLFQQDAKPTACRMCHGIKGNGNGRLAINLDPPPRNFICTETMQVISDGQLFWIIKNGSPGTKMPAHIETLTDREIWQLILYIRNF